MLRIPALMTEGEDRTREIRDEKAEEFASYLASPNGHHQPSGAAAKRGDLFAPRLGKSKSPWNPMFPDRTKEAKSPTRPDSKEPLAFLESSRVPSEPSSVATPPEKATAVVKSDPMSQVSLKIGSLLQQGGGKMLIRLAPEQWGRVEIEVIAKGNEIAISMRSELKSTKEALETKVEELKRGLHARDLVATKIEFRHDRWLALPESLRHFLSDSSGQQQQAFSQGFRRPGSWPDVPGDGPVPLRNPSGLVSTVGVASGHVDIRI